MKLTQAEYDNLTRRAKIPTSDDKADEGPESVLSGKIVRWAKNHGFPCQCFRQSRKAKGFLVPGWPD